MICERLESVKEFEEACVHCKKGRPDELWLNLSDSDSMDLKLEKPVIMSHFNNINIYFLTLSAKMLVTWTDVLLTDSNQEQMS